MCGTDVPLLLLFTGQFIMVQGLVDTGVPKCLWGALIPTHPLGEGFESEGDIDLFSTFGFIVSVLILSNLLSNVPLILMMRPMLNELDDREAKAVWLVVAFVCELDHIDSHEQCLCHADQSRDLCCRVFRSGDCGKSCPDRQLG